MAEGKKEREREVGKGERGFTKGIAAVDIRQLVRNANRIQQTEGGNRGGEEQQDKEMISLHTATAPCAIAIYRELYTVGVIYLVSCNINRGIIEGRHDSIVR